MCHFEEFNLQTELSGGMGWESRSNGGGNREKRGREMEYPRGRELGEIVNEFHNIGQYFTMKKNTEAGTTKGGGAGTWSTRYKECKVGRSSPVVENFSSSLVPEVGGGGT